MEGQSEAERSRQGPLWSWRCVVAVIYRLTATASALEQCPI